jgi:hypothetical protein
VLVAIQDLPQHLRDLGAGAAGGGDESRPEIPVPHRAQRFEQGPQVRVLAPRAVARRAEPSSS